jgi:RNA polymerase sigma factor (sigma-70 family)
MSPANLEDLNDEQLWRLVSERSLMAFEEFVRRHQAAVASVAYCICGDVTLSEDIAQEAFLAAWQTSENLREPQKSRAWVCGIARNLANGEIRRTRRHIVSLQTLHSDDEPTSDLPDMADSIVRAEEESIVWKSLEEIPANYRESLILYYRENQSITSIAQTLEITEDTARQRLSRGRELLRHQVAAMIEGALVKTKPSAAFTASVMAAVAVMSGTAKAAMTSTGAGIAGSMIAKSATAGAVGGVVGGLAGAAGGLGGGWLGTWIPAQLAPTNRERVYLLKHGKRMLAIAAVSMLLFFAITFGLVNWQAPAGWQLGSTLIFMVGFQIWATVESLKLRRVIRQIRAEANAETDPNPSPVGRQFRSKMSRFEGRVWQSRTMLLGRPLVDINVSDLPTEWNIDAQSQLTPKIARGWIAIGDKAHGILLAIGGSARGIVAIGGMAIGVVSFGGLSIGIISLGGLAIGLAAFGGGSLGGIAFGGLAVGYQALGGFALAWDFACGGGAVAHNWAYGGGAWANKAAVGGGAYAPLANTPELRQVMEAHWLVRAINWQVANNGLFLAVVLIGSIGPSLLMMPLFYRRKRKDSEP